MGRMRSFKGIREPAPSYDAIVIGAGIGGLVCANLLQRAGMQVLLIEQHYVVGGYCSTFRRHGYTFDAATHFYPLLGNPTTITGRLLNELGVTTQWVKMDPVDVFHFPDSSSFSVPADFDLYIAKLKAEFPAEAAALDRFFALVREVYLLGLLQHFRWRATEKLAPYRDLTLQQALDRCFLDPKLKLLLTADGPHWGSPPSRVSFVFDSMLRLSYFLGNYYPRGGSQAFADELARCFEAQGGHILLSSLVHRILLSNGTACGVELETGPLRERRRQRVQADVVVSNADLLLTLERMVGAEHLPSDYLAPIRQLRPTYPCFLTHIGLRDMPLETLRAAHGYHWNEWDAEAMGTTALKCKVFVPTLYEPRMAPPGGQVVIVQKVLAMDYRAVTDWAAHKASIENFVMAHLERLLPGLAEKVVVRLSASARTSYRYTLNHQGAMLGWEMAPDQLGERRVGVTSPIQGLYFTGHWTQPGGGITPVIVSAMQVAKLITGAVPRAEASIATSIG
jgi:all-trans-retinol 13,14-reductase